MKENIFIMENGPSETLFKQARIMANDILFKTGIGLSWAELPDTNSLWDYLYGVSDPESLFEQVREAVTDRLSDSGYGNTNEIRKFIRYVNVLSLNDLNA